MTERQYNGPIRGTTVFELEGGGRVWTLYLWTGFDREIRTMTKDENLSSKYQDFVSLQFCNCF